MEHIALYRQFRPMDFDEIVEQKTAVAALRQSVRTKRIGHAYLFCGQRGTGKTSIARVFSRAINCEAPVNGNPCNKCPTCKGILDGTLMDVIEIDAASNTSIENIKKICEEVNYAPSRAPYKVYIIDEVHMISTGAFNALLKTLEEPPSHAVFLFATTEPHKIPATILSRCQRYDFRRISQEAITARLAYICKQEKINAEDDSLKLIASLSDGAMRDAISVLDQAASTVDGGKITAELIEDMTGTVNMSFLADMAEILIKGQSDKLLLKCKELENSGRDAIHFALDLAGYFRNLLILRVVPDPSNLVMASASNLRRMYTIASSTNADTLIAFISYLSKMISDLKWSPSVRTSFEIALIRVCGRHVKGEDTPLVIPDFAQKQEEAAKKISFTMPSLSSPSSDDSTETDGPAKTITFTAPPKTDSLPPILRSSEPSHKEEEMTEEEKAADRFTAHFDGKNMEGVDELRKKTQELLKKIKGDKAEKEEKTGSSEELQIPVPSEPEEKDPDDMPLENQLDIFSMASAPAREEKKTTVSVADNKSADIHEEDVSVTPGDDEADDIPVNGEDAEPEEDDRDITLEPAHGRYEHTSLVAAVRKEGIVEKKAPADAKAIWESVTARAADTDFVLYQMLCQADFRVDGDSAYIVFEDDKPSLMERIKNDPSYRKLSTDVKSAMSEIEHVYLCTERQFRKAMSKKNGTSEEPEDKAAEFIKKSRDAGISAEIHFGDD